MRGVADGIARFLRPDIEFVRGRNELPRDGIGGIAAVDQPRHVGRDGDGVARRDSGERYIVIGEPGLRQPAHIADGQGRGVHITCSMRSAPLASMTSRSKPSATPLAAGMTATAARKSSSTG